MKKASFFTFISLLFGVLTLAQGHVEAEAESSDNTLMYVSIAAAIAVGAGGIYLYSKRKKE